MPRTTSCATACVIPLLRRAAPAAEATILFMAGRAGAASTIRLWADRMSPRLGRRWSRARVAPWYAAASAVARAACMGARVAAKAAGSNAAAPNYGAPGVEKRRRARGVDVSHRGYAGLLGRVGILGVHSR